MGYDSIVRKGVASADKMTDSLQCNVQHFAWIGSNDYGGPDYEPSPIIRRGIVEEKEYLRRLPDGQEVTQKASITFPRPIAANGAADRREPIDPRDKLILPSGYTGPILGVFGVVDPSTQQPYSFEVIMG